jgi:hypothetical protein
VDGACWLCALLELWRYRFGQTISPGSENGGCTVTLLIASPILLEGAVPNYFGQFTVDLEIIKSCTATS